MYFFLIPIPFIIIDTIITWRARNREDYKTVAVHQPLTTILIIVVALLSFFAPAAKSGYTIWILAGLIVSLIGDFFNINMWKNKTLYAAIVVFLIAYLIYPIGITVYNGFHPQDLIVGGALLLVFFGIMAFIWKGLGGGWKIPVIIYGLAMLFMVSRGISTFFGDVFSLTQAILLTIGTSILFIADSEYSIHRFIKPRKMIIGPILYPTGQLLIALSCSFFPLL